MDTEKLFELATRLVEANIRAGQFLDYRNFETIIRDQVPMAFQALAETWTSLSDGGEELH